MPARLTFAIPFHANLVYLDEAVKSVLDQRDPDWQLLVSDDGTTDQGVADRIAALADDRIQYYRRPSRGMVANWMFCLETARTELVTLLHADDRLLPGYTTLMKDLAARFPDAVALCCSTSIIDASGASRFSTADAVKRFFIPSDEDAVVVNGESGLRAIMAGNFIQCPTLCFRRGVLGERGFEDRWRQVQDLALTSRLLLDGETIVHSREVAYAYRRHAEGATAQQSESLLRFAEEFRLFDEVANAARQKGWHEAAGVAAGKRIVRLHLAYRALRELLRLRPLRAIELLRYRGGAVGPSGT